MGSRVTTKNGDTGATRTLAGAMVSKGDTILECTGRVDTLRARLALLRLQLLQEGQPASEHAPFLFWLIHACFLIGTEVNDPEAVHPEYRIDTLGPAHLARLEAEQARLEAQLQLPRAFIATATTIPAAEADLAATAARDLERELVRLSSAIPGFHAEHLLAFTNRLSDYLYILARHIEAPSHCPVDYGVLKREEN